MQLGRCLKNNEEPQDGHNVSVTEDQIDVVHDLIVAQPSLVDKGQHDKHKTPNGGHIQKQGIKQPCMV